MKSESFSNFENKSLLITPLSPLILRGEEPYHPFLGWRIYCKLAYFGWFVKPKNP